MGMLPAVFQTAHEKKFSANPSRWMSLPCDSLRVVSAPLVQIPVAGFATGLARRQDERARHVYHLSGNMTRWSLTRLLALPSESRLDLRTRVADHPIKIEFSTNFLLELWP